MCIGVSRKVLRWEDKRDSGKRNFQLKSKHLGTSFQTRRNPSKSTDEVKPTVCTYSGIQLYKSAPEKKAL